MATDLDWQNPFALRRAPVLARNVVATSHPLAVQAGLEMFRRGGNAVDAALAAAIALTVVEPCSNGLGSDASAMVWDGGELVGLNGSGRSPAAWTPDRFAGLDQMPLHGWDSVTVPGAVSAWVALSDRFGQLPFRQLVEPAVHYAREGFHVSPITARAWAGAMRSGRYDSCDEWQRVFAPEGRTPRVGELFKLPDHARSLELIAGSRGEAFYRGQLAQRITAHAAACGGALTADDLAAHECLWVAPLRVRYREVELCELPPNGQGIAALIAAGILNRLDLGNAPHHSAQQVHCRVEAMRLGLQELHAHVGDPAQMRVAPSALLAEAALDQLAAQVPIAASGTSSFEPRGGTVYLAAADAAGRMVSYIQSNYHGFGSGIVAPGTGIALQNRGSGFVLSPGHANQVGPRRLPLHTIIPGFIMRDCQPWVSFGVMGGPMQAQGHLQLLVRLVDQRMNPQSAVDAPRWRISDDGSELLMERGTAHKTVRGLRELGHRVRLAPGKEFGGAQVVQKLVDGYVAGSDPRKDGQAGGF